MIAVDTNVVVRLLVNDEPRQFRKAYELFERGDVWIGSTVLLETERVLRSAYRLPREEIHHLLDNVLSLPGVSCEDRARAHQALENFSKGLDFADALHLAGANHLDSFATFDRDLARKAGRLGVVDIMAL